MAKTTDPSGALERLRRIRLEAGRKAMATKRRKYGEYGLSEIAHKAAETRRRRQENS